MQRGETIDERLVFDGRVVRLALETVRLPNGATVELEMIRHQGAAAVVPLDGEDHVWLVRQYRHAVGAWLLEVPAGKLDAGEAPEACARRELEEEAGLAAGRLEPLGSIVTTPGFTDERIWLFAATELRPARQALEHDELLTVERLPLDDAVRRAITGEIEDGKSVCALLRLSERRRAGRA